ncbi:protein draper-like [Haliotis asinina]|uniref:protein draper-like n=1 Tax=Haliotis asinina TaxID=109174 RepID=UPI0035322D0F
MCSFWMGIFVACVSVPLAENVALRRTSSQSSSLGNRPDLFGAALGVDGRATTNAISQPWTCVHTQDETNPTWTVYLNTSVPEKIQHIRLYIRDRLQERSNGMEILVGNQMCYNWSSTEHPPPIANVTCRQPLTGTTVTIRIPGQLKFLSLCEAQIFVCSDGWFSEECDKQCRCLNSTDVCDKITGHCSSGCFPGYNGTDCQTVCPHGSYGSNCHSRCGNCLNNDICDKTNGICPGGCAAGWKNTTCLQVCPDGFYGINCVSQCGNWLDGVSCDKTSGICPNGCAAGWMNDGTCLQQEGCSWGIPVATVLGILLICTVTGATIYIRRLLKQLEILETKMREEHYVTLDEKTKTTATESTYEHIDSATPYYNTVNHLQDETG